MARALRTDKFTTSAQSIASIETNDIGCALVKKREEDLIMRTRLLLPIVLLGCACGASPGTATQDEPAGTVGQALSVDRDRGEDEGERNEIRHVLLISVDGMHESDLAGFVAGHPSSTLAKLSDSGVAYADAHAPTPTDSFPGLTALVTGGTPKSTGIYYDDSYDRTLFPPSSDCTGAPGTEATYFEILAVDFNKLFSPLDPNNLPRAKDAKGNCKPVFPHEFIQVNTIFEVIRAAGGYTAWSDKHAGYASVSGPTGTNQPSNVDDYYSPEVNSLQIALPGLKTAALTPGASFDCGTLVPNGDDWTTDFDAIKCNDQLKVNAVLNQIHGRTHLGASKAPVPVIFGMNFQAVSVGQKLIEPKSAVRTDANSGGYEDAAGTPRPKMLAEIQYVDAAIGQMVDALKHEGLLDSTTIIITAKHGQSPIDPNRFFPIPGHSGNNGTPPSGFVGPLLPAVYNDPNNGLGLAEDDISQIWLADSTRTADAVTALENNATAFGSGQIYFGASLNTIFNPPGVPETPGPCCKLREGGDPRTPDIVVIPNVGVVYTGNLKKQSEHGGFAADDTNVMLLVSNPHVEAHTVNSFVETAQVAPTILKILGLDPDALDAVREEGTPVLPSLFREDGQDN